MFNHVAFMYVPCIFRCHFFTNIFPIIILNQLAGSRFRNLTIKHLFYHIDLIHEILFSTKHNLFIWV